MLIGNETHIGNVIHLFYFQSLYLPNFLHEYFDHITFCTADIQTENPEPPLPQPIATNGAGVCEYDITNATANYDTVSMTTLGHQLKDNLIIIATWMHHIYSKKLAKWAKKPQKVYGPHNCRASTFKTENNQCRGCRCNRYKGTHMYCIIKVTMNGNDHNDNNNSNLIITQLLMNSIFNQLLDDAFL